MATALACTHAQAVRERRRRAWVTRRDRYGPSGHLRHRRKGGRPRVMYLGGLCRQSHHLTSRNAYRNRQGYVRCQLCRKLARAHLKERRRLWRRLQAVEPQLRRQLIRAHPDHGGSIAELDRLLTLYRKVRKELGL